MQIRLEFHNRALINRLVHDTCVMIATVLFSDAVGQWRPT